MPKGVSRQTAEPAAGLWLHTHTGEWGLAGKGWEDWGHWEGRETGLTEAQPHKGLQSSCGVTLAQLRSRFCETLGVSSPLCARFLINPKRI